ncbi:hypothetical protein H4R35_006640 [Dimargaris xerosporica]|nr:hypothetical protein H4R35_006640 [Dimargaris xerosporica]
MHCFWSLRSQWIPAMKREKPGLQTVHCLPWGEGRLSIPCIRFKPIAALALAVNPTQRRFAGHNKWSQIKRDKASNDSKRGMVFTKLALAITSAVKEAGENPHTNVRLAAAIEDAKKQSMPKATIERAISRGLGATNEQLTYEVYQGYGPHQIALMMEAMTDNPNRTIQRIRSILSRTGGAVASVDWRFTKKAKVHFTPGSTSDTMETMLANGIDAGAEDISQVGTDKVEVVCAFEDLGTVSQALQQQHNYQVVLAQRYYMPEDPEPLSADQRAELQQTLDALADIDDVIRVHTNAEQLPSIPE